MGKRTNASDFGILSKDETDTIIDLGYDCPYCHEYSGEVISVSGNTDFDFETNQVCVFCCEEVTIECRY